MFFSYRRYAVNFRKCWVHWARSLLSAVSHDVSSQSWIPSTQHHSVCIAVQVVIMYNIIYHCVLYCYIVCVSNASFWVCSGPTLPSSVFMPHKQHCKECLISERCELVRGVVPVSTLNGERTRNCDKLGQAGSLHSNSSDHRGPLSSLFSTHS